MFVLMFIFGCSNPPGPHCAHLRHPNNHSPATALAWQKLATAVQYCYGYRYQRAVEYLEALSANSFWEDSTPGPLPWHESDAEAVQIGGPRYVMHDAVLNALAPAQPLRAVFGGNRRH